MEEQKKPNEKEKGEEKKLNHFGQPFDLVPPTKQSS